MSAHHIPGGLEGAGVCLSATRALCHACGRLVEAKIVLREQGVFLVKWCPEHRMTEALACSDPGWYLRSLGYVKPGTSPRLRAIEQYRGCPDSCGLCPEHQQHTCLPVLEITERCDLDCPICLTGRWGRRDITPRQVRAILDRLVRAEGRLNMLNLSGGEPTLHPEFLAIVDEARRPEIGMLSVSTNGLSLASDEDLIRALRDREVLVSLQFDGLRSTTYGALRGRPELAREKMWVLERLLALGACVSLTVTMARGINEDELEAILGLLFAEDGILSVMVQPIAHTGRGRSFSPGDPIDRLTIPDVVPLLAAASRGVLADADFTPLPCSHPSCFALTYLLKTDGNCLVPLPRLIGADEYLDIIKNQALLDTGPDTLERLRDSLYALWSSEGQIPDRDAVLRKVRAILLELDRIGRSAPHRDLLQLGTRHVKSIFIHHFMDRYTFDLARAVKCCHHYPQVDGRLLPACIRNNGLAGMPGGGSPAGRPAPE